MFTLVLSLHPVYDINHDTDLQDFKIIYDFFSNSFSYISMKIFK